MEQELARVREAQQELTEKTRVIPLYLTPAAAGYASPALEEDYEDYAVDASCKADFAVRIDGDSMEPVIHDGSVALVCREPIENGDVGMFFIDGDMKCKQYCRDNYGNIYLLSINRARGCGCDHFRLLRRHALLLRQGTVGAPPAAAALMSRRAVSRNYEILRSPLCTFCAIVFSVLP